MRCRPKPAILPRMLRRALGPSALVVAVAVGGWLISGVALLDIIKFLGYDAAFVAIPGAALLWAIRGRRSHFLVTVALGWPLGQALEVLAFSATAAIGFRALFLAFPVVVTVPSAVVIWRRRERIEQDPDPGGMSQGLMWAAATMLSLGLIYLTIMFLPQAPLPSSSVLVEYPDFPYFIGLITQVLYHWPPASPGLYGVPLAYEWFVLFHMAAASQVTHLSIPTIALRMDYVPTIVVLACQLLAVGRFVGRAAWTGAIAIGVLLILGPLDLIASPKGGAFRDSVLINLWNSWTFPFGLLFFLALVYLITERLRANTWRTPSDLGSWTLIALLMIGASGAKATVLPVVIAGTGLYVMVHLLLRRSAPPAALVTLGLGIVVFTATYLVIYAGAAPDTVVKLFAWLSGTPAVVFAESIHHALLRKILLPFAYAAGLAGFLLPLVAILYLLRRRYHREITSFALLLCMLIGSIFIASVVHQISYSEGYFEETGYIAGVIVAAAGLRLAWLDVGLALPLTRRAAIVIAGGSIALLIVVAKPESRSITTPKAIMMLYAGLFASGVIFVIAWAIVMRARRRSATGNPPVGLDPTPGSVGAHHAARSLSDRQELPRRRNGNVSATCAQPWSLDGSRMATCQLIGRRRLRCQQPLARFRPAQRQGLLLHRVLRPSDIHRSLRSHPIRRHAGHRNPGGDHLCIPPKVERCGLRPCRRGCAAHHDATLLSTIPLYRSSPWH